MKKRLRKKYRVGEYQEFGFALELELAQEGKGGEAPEMLQRFLNDAVEANQLCASGGGHGNKWQFFLCSCTRHGSVTEEQRQQVMNWLAGAPGLASHLVGPLVDAWYGQA